MLELALAYIPFSSDNSHNNENARIIKLPLMALLDNKIIFHVLVQLSH